MDEIFANKIKEYVKLIKVGDMSAVESLYVLFAPKLDVIGKRYFNQVDNDDFKQEFWLNIQKICTKCSFVKNCYGYLLKSAQNFAKNYLKKIKRANNRKISLTESVENSLEAKPFWEELEANDVVAKALKSLNKVEKETFLDSVYLEKSYREISKEQKVSKSQVGKIRSGATQKLKKFLQSVDKG